MPTYPSFPPKQQYKQKAYFGKYGLWKVVTVFQCDLYFVPPLSLFVGQASQLGVYRAFVDNYEVAVETAEKCCQANTQFAEISEVM